MLAVPHISFLSIVWISVPTSPCRNGNLPHLGGTEDGQPQRLFTYFPHGSGWLRKTGPGPTSNAFCQTWARSVTELLRWNSLHTRRKCHNPLSSKAVSFSFSYLKAPEMSGQFKTSLLREVHSAGAASRLKRENKPSMERCWCGHRSHSRPKSPMNHSNGPMTTASLPAIFSI